MQLMYTEHVSHAMLKEVLIWSMHLLCVRYISPDSLALDMVQCTYCVSDTFPLISPESLALDMVPCTHCVSDTLPLTLSHLIWFNALTVCQMHFP